MVTELNNRDIGGGMHHAIQIQQEICSLYNELKEMQLQASSNLPSNTDDAIPGSRNSGNGPVPIKLYNYGGQFCILPPKFEIPCFLESFGNRDTLKFFYVFLFFLWVGVLLGASWNLGFECFSELRMYILYRFFFSEF